MTDQSVIWRGGTRMSNTVANRAGRAKATSRKPASRKPPSRKVSPSKSASRKASAPKAPERTPSSSSTLAERQAEKRDAILNAALDEFSASGFAAARLD